MLEQSCLSVSQRAANVRSDTAARLLTEMGWKVYRASYPRMGGDVSVFCRDKKSARTRLFLVKAEEIDHELKYRL